jgi:hypothetical protein
MMLLDKHHVLTAIEYPRINLFFPKFSHCQNYHLQITREAIYSTTLFTDMKPIITITEKYCRKTGVLISNFSKY